MSKEYVTAVDGTYRIGSTRVSLDSLVDLYREGVSAEGIAESFPFLSLEQIHGALAFYLANRSDIDAYLADGQRAAEVEQRRSAEQNAGLITRLRRARHEASIPG